MTSAVEPVPTLPDHQGNAQPPAARPPLAPSPVEIGPVRSIDTA